MATAVSQVDKTLPGGMEIISSAPVGNLDGRPVSQFDALAYHCRDQAELSKQAAIITAIGLVIVVAAGITAIVTFGAFAGPLAVLIGAPVLCFVVSSGIFLISAWYFNYQKNIEVAKALQEDTAFIDFARKQNANENNILKIYDSYQSQKVDRYRYEYGTCDSITFYQEPRF